MVVSPETSSTGSRHRIPILIAVALAVAAAYWLWNRGVATPKPKTRAAIPVVSAAVTQTDVPVRLVASGMVMAVQMVEVRPQVSATIKAVHIREGQFVRKGQRLFSLDARAEDAGLSSSKALVAKDRADLENAERNFERQRKLFEKEYISRTEFEAAQNQVALLRGQLEVDSALLDASRVARSYNEITAPISGRSGAIAVYPGSLVQPNGIALTTIAQVDPIDVSFTLPERELAALQQAYAGGAVKVQADPGQTDQAPLEGKLVFIDNIVDSASGTIRLKARFDNAGHRLWPGMFVSVTLAPRTLSDVLTVPAQAVQTGPERQFVYVIGKDRSVTTQPVKLSLIQDNLAVIEGVPAGTRIVVEGAQNLRPGSRVTETTPQTGKTVASGNAGKQ